MVKQDKGLVYPKINKKSYYCTKHIETLIKTWEISVSPLKVLKKVHKDIKAIQMSQAVQ